MGPYESKLDNDRLGLLVELRRIVKEAAIEAVETTDDVGVVSAALDFILPAVTSDRFKQLLVDLKEREAQLARWRAELDASAGSPG